MTGKQAVLRLTPQKMQGGKKKGREKKHKNMEKNTYKNAIVGVGADHVDILAMKS